ncbi:unnamed protein product [Phytomonas sp. EM1]|nr:unnamed protein product [Phytomonas sp. EM1]|eukprot:CCW60068.1 unnamed protein product [Phytomonas sp. isolate EM1]
MRSLGSIFGIKTDKAMNEINKPPSKSAVSSCTDDYKDNKARCALSSIGLSPSDSYGNKYDDVMLSEAPLETEEIPVSEVADFFKAFQHTLCECKDMRERHNVVKKAKMICLQIAHSRATLTHEEFACAFGKPSTAIQSLLEEIQEESVALRARHALALYHFCLELDQEFEDELFSCGTGFLASLRRENTLGFPDVTHEPNPATAPPTTPPTLKRCQDLDLVKIYRNLLKGGGYLPTAAEMNEILIRADGIFRDLPNIVMVPLPVVVVGDIHGQIRDLREHVLSAGGPLVSEEKLRAASIRAGAPAKENTKICKGSANHSCKIRSEGLNKVGNLPQENVKQPTSSSFHHQPDSTAIKSKATQGRKSTERAALEDGSSGKNPSRDMTKASTYLFLGDYVDRGKGSLECLCLLLVAKLLSPDTVFLLRGNHECSLVNRHYGFLEECHRMYPIINNCVRSSVFITPATVNSEGGTLKQVREGKGSSHGGSPPGGGLQKKTGKKSGGESEAGMGTTDLLTTAEEAANQAAQLESEQAAMDAMEWDLSDHPLWIIANKVFECLPICAAIYETVERVGCEGPQGEKDVSAAPRRTKSCSNPTPLKESKVEIADKPSKFINRVRNEDDKRQVVRICAMHGGLSPHIGNSLDGIIAVNRFKVIENGALADLTWSDPISSAQGSSDSCHHEAGDGANCLPGDNTNYHLVFKNNFDFSVPVDYDGPVIGFSHNARGTGHTFGEDVTCSFLKKNKINYIIRAHQCVQKGFQWLHQHRVLTIFSASNYCGTGNKGSIAILDEHGIPELIQYSHIEATEDVEVDVTAPIPPRKFL